MYSDKLKMIAVLGITISESLLVTLLLSRCSDYLGYADSLILLIRLFTTPLFVCLVGLKFLKEYFARIGVFIFLLVDILICSVNNLGWDSLLILMNLKENGEALLVYKYCYAATIIFYFIVYYLLVAIMKDKYQQEGCREE